MGKGTDEKTHDVNISRDSPPPVTLEFVMCERDTGQGFACLTGMTQELTETVCEKIPWQTKHNIKCCLLILGESKTDQSLLFSLRYMGPQ